MKLPQISVIALILSGVGVLAFPSSDTKNRREAAVCSGDGGPCYMGNTDPARDCCKGLMCGFAFGEHVGTCGPSPFEKRDNDIQGMQQLQSELDITSQTCKDRYCMSDESCPCSGWFCKTKGGFCTKRNSPTLPQKRDALPGPQMDDDMPPLGKEKRADGSCGYMGEECINHASCCPGYRCRDNKESGKKLCSYF
ncbi:uncharacterized protein BDCG_07634 [Blastomyces dermatitidis ER-3]|uniref:Uncharacterized protein n=2 Tax=Ajellomyces dermatitidis TaxID=5039 RepID=F2TJX3_AJEDA|nr:uncharacterized protein BDCG_07634 [Blastomyces dermatitidis ER-3]EEQ92514.1 hypothetical protein BDCG_07634 [Blastomyces dermatitidis ER-3]EGE83536.1 hypothetical protein BDDG_06480 [Blastomyces dermatitidis ATCC 18188]EQL31562.1 hypothetical protein BDFG_06137 [Blastomyces dermatitidis ATCC 26199]